MSRINMKPMPAFMCPIAYRGSPILLFSDPTAIPQCSPWDLCATGDLGSMESNVMAGRALFGCLQLPDGQRRCAIFLVHEKVTQGSSKSAEYRAYRRIAPKSLELVIVSQPAAQTFCGRLLLNICRMLLTLILALTGQNQLSSMTREVAENCWSLLKQIQRDFR